MRKLFFIAFAFMLIISCKKENKYYLTYKVKCRQCIVSYMGKELTEKEVKESFDMPVINNVGGVISIVNMSNDTAFAYIYERGLKREFCFVKNYLEQKTISFER